MYPLWYTLSSYSKSQRLTHADCAVKRTSETWLMIFYLQKPSCQDGNMGFFQWKKREHVTKTSSKTQEKTATKLVFAEGCMIYGFKRHGDQNKPQFYSNFVILCIPTTNSWKASWVWTAISLPLCMLFHSIWWWNSDAKYLLKKGNMTSGQFVNQKHVAYPKKHTTVFPNMAIFGKSPCFLGIHVNTIVPKHLPCEISKCNYQLLIFKNISWLVNQATTTTTTTTRTTTEKQLKTNGDCWHWFWS